MAEPTRLCADAPTLAQRREWAARTPATPPEPVYACPICKDQRFVNVETKQGRLETVPCRCQAKPAAERRRAALRALDGLTERERALRFEALIPGANAAAIDAVQEAVRAGHGLITLSGPPGCGKSALLFCAVNAACEAGVPAHYTTLTDLLDYLRAGFDCAGGDRAGHDYPGGEEEAPPFEARWKLISEADVLALDEIDEFHASGWALERFLRLIDVRWRALDQRLTLLATNGGLDALPAKVASRLRDGRAQRLALSGPDLRPYLG